MNEKYNVLENNNKETNHHHNNHHNSTNNIFLSQNTAVRNQEEEEEEQNHNSHLKSKKSNSMYNNKNDIIIDKDQGHSEYARSFYSLNNIKYSYVKPSNSNSTANNLDIYERAASPSYSMGKLDSNQNQQKSVDSSMDNQSFQLLYPYKDFYPLSLSHSSYSTKINGLSSSTTFNNDNNKNINDGSHTNNNGINENNLSMVSNSSVDIIKALSSSLKKGYFSSEAYLKYKKSSHNRNEGNSKKINDLHIYNLQTRTNGKDRSYYDNTSTGINSEYINDSGNDGTMPTIKLLNLQLQREREMKKAEEIVDESFERRPQYNHSVNDIKNGILKIRSILNSNSNNVNTKDFNLNSYNVITANTPINSLSNSHRKHHSLNMNSDHYNKTYNLSKDLIYFNKKLNEYNNQKKKYFNDNSSYSSDNNSDVNVFRTNIINFSQSIKSHSIPSKYNLNNNNNTNNTNTNSNSNLINNNYNNNSNLIKNNYNNNIKSTNNQRKNINTLNSTVKLANPHKLKENDINYSYQNNNSSKGNNMPLGNIDGRNSTNSLGRNAKAKEIKTFNLVINQSNEKSNSSHRSINYKNNLNTITTTTTSITTTTTTINNNNNNINDLKLTDNIKIILINLQIPIKP
jgi:hypothetical protein